MSPGDHSGFGTALDHVDYCQGQVYAWSDEPVQLDLFAEVL